MEHCLLLYKLAPFPHASLDQVISKRKVRWDSLQLYVDLRKCVLGFNFKDDHLIWEKSNFVMTDCPFNLLKLGLCFFFCFFFLKEKYYFDVKKKNRIKISKSECNVSQVVRSIYEGKIMIRLFVKYSMK